MKTRNLIVTLLALTLVPALIAASGEGTQKDLQGYAKNLARQHVGANLFVFDAGSSKYVPTEAAAAWLDDDVTTGWPPLSGKQAYLLVLPEPQLVTSFALSARGGTGKVTLSAGDEPAAPGSASWTALARDVDFASVNDKVYDKPLNRLAKYILIETDLSDAAPCYSLYVYGDRAAVTYALQQREKAIDTEAIFGPFVNNQTAFNYSSLYADSRVTYGAADSQMVALQRAIDDNPESAIELAPTQQAASFVLRYDKTRPIGRIAVLVAPGTKGKLDFFLVNRPPSSAPMASTSGSQILRVSNTNSGGIPVANAGYSVEGMTPTASIVFDGSTARSSMDFPSVSTSTLMARWTPEDGSQSLALRELNSFGDLELASYTVSPGLQTVARSESGQDYSDYKDTDGKSLADYKKEVLPPMAELLPTKSPFIPGTIGFPPNLPPEEPRSP